MNDSDTMNNIVDKETLQDNLSFTSLYIAVYEYMIDYVESYVKQFLCNIEFSGNEIHFKKTPQYQDEILNRIVDQNGNKDKVKALFLWLVDNEAITPDDYADFICIKDLRNRYAHELLNIIIIGVPVNDVTLFLKMISLLSKLCKWFYINFEVPVMGLQKPTEEDLATLCSGSDMFLQVIIDVLYKGQSKQYKEKIDKFRAGGVK